MSDTLRNDERKQQIRHLRELIAALERVGETAIARDAAALKDKALKRLAELQADVEQLVDVSPGSLWSVRLTLLSVRFRNALSPSRRSADW